MASERGSIATRRLDRASGTPFELVSQPRQGSLVASVQDDLAFRYVARMSCDVCVVVVVVAVVAAAVVVADCMRTLAGSAGGGDGKSMGSAANEVDRRTDRSRSLKAKEGERSNVNCYAEA